MSDFKKALLALALALSMTAVSCGSASDAVRETSASGEAQTTAAEVTTAAYDYSGKSYGGYVYRIYNSGDIYTMHSQLDRDEMNGEPLNDALYERNRHVEKQMDITIKETVLGPSNGNFPELISAVKSSVEAGDDNFDMTFLPPRQGASMLMNGYFLDLATLPQLALDEEWYNQSYNECVTIGGKLFIGMGDISIMLTDGIWAMFFNEDILADRKLSVPYKLAEDGKWTLDRLFEYTSAAASLNGDSSFAWNKNGSCLYGLSTGNYMNYRALNGCSERVVENQNGKLTFTAGSEHFYNVIDKLYKVMSPAEGAAYYGEGSDYDAEKGNYIYAFSAERALFLTAEICKTQGFRSFEFSYGLVPFPKYDENQERYYSSIYEEALAFAVPVTTKDSARSAAVIDALCYEGMKQVVPVYRDIVVEHKGLRNDESIKMLDIIMDSAFADVGTMFNLNQSFVTAIGAEIRNHAGTAASVVEAQKSTITAGIVKINDAYAALK